MQDRGLTLSFLIMLSACPAARVPTTLAVAEVHEREGHVDQALLSYSELAKQCLRRNAPKEKYCAAALLGRARTLERLGRYDEAVQAFEDASETGRADDAAKANSLGTAAETGRADDAAGFSGKKGTRVAADRPNRYGLEPEARAVALGQAARLELGLGHDVRAYELMWRTIGEYPETTAATEALRLVVRDGRKRAPRALFTVLGQLYERLASSAIGDNLLWSMAVIAEDDLAEPNTALELFDRLARTHRHSPLRDDALWHAAQIARTLRDFQGALRRLRELLSTRELALFIGSYFSVWLDNAQLAVGTILRDELGDPKAAREEFEHLIKDYPDSTLLDDTLYELAVTLAQLEDHDGACSTLFRLHGTYPDSRFELELAPTLRSRLGCDD